MTIMKRYILFASALVLAAACEKVPTASDFDGEFLVYTAHSEEAGDFARFETFTVADSLLAIDGDRGSMFLNDWAKSVRNQYIEEMEAKGWTCFDDYLDTQWVTASPHKGEYLAFTLRIDTRRIPAGVIRKHVTLALKKEKLANLAQGKTYISKERKKEIKEQVTLRLRQRFLPVPAEINVVWSIRKNEVWLASVQNKVIELFMQLFLDTFQLHLQQLTPSALAIQLMGEGQVETIDRIVATVFA